jgi:hypothetical protein
VQLTAKGEACYLTLRKLFDDFERTTREIAAAGPRRKISINLFQSLLSSWLFDLIPVCTAPAKKMNGRRDLRRSARSCLNCTTKCPPMANRTGGSLLDEAPAVNGEQEVFGVPGESYLEALDAFSGAASAVEYITCRQEGGASFMAGSYARLTGKPGVCFVTRGPGAANASIGVHTAYQDSAPMILLIGQVPRSSLDREAFQEVGFCRMFGEMTKWVAQVDDAARIPEYVNRAFQTALSGCPGRLANSKAVLLGSTHRPG